MYEQNVKIQKTKGVNYFKEIPWVSKQLHDQLLAASLNL